MQISSYINWKNVLGFTAAFYLGTYLHLRGGIAEAPILLSGLFALISGMSKSRGKLLDGLSRNERWFVAALFLFGAWSAFTVWLDDAAPSFYESPARFIVGSLVAIPILKHRVDVRWVQLGAAISAILLIQLVATSYNGGRFAPSMNATKWGNAIAFHSLLCAALAIVSKSIQLRIFFALAAIFGVYATSITGTRGAMLPVVLGLAYLGILSVRSIKGWVAIIAGLFVVAVLALQIPIVKNRVVATQSEVSRLLNDDFKGSIGQRLTMWAAGIQAGLRSPLLGDGYDYAKTMNNYVAPTEGLATAAALAAKTHSNHHSAYVDTLARSGVVGIIFFFLILVFGITNCNLVNRVLVVAPIIGFAGAGVSDSALMLGITVTYLTLSASILKVVEMKSEDNRNRSSTVG